LPGLAEVTEKVRDTVSWLAHDGLQEAISWFGGSHNDASKYHEKIDTLFATEFAPHFTEEALSKRPQVTMGMLPPPGGGLTSTAKRVATVASSAGVATGAAAAGSVLTQSANLRALESNPSTRQFSEAGKVQDREGLTRAGRALQKHGGRTSSVFPKPTGNISQINAQGQEVLENILSNPNNELIETPSGNIKIYTPDGRGAHFDKNKRFIGFIERQYE